MTTQQQQQQQQNALFPESPPPETLPDGLRTMAALMGVVGRVAGGAQLLAEQDKRTNATDLPTVLHELEQEASAAASRLEVMAGLLAEGGGTDDGEEAVQAAQAALHVINRAAGPLPPSLSLECWTCNRVLLISVTDAEGFCLDSRLAPQVVRGVTLPCPFCMADKKAAFPLERKGNR